MRSRATATEAEPRRRPGPGLLGLLVVLAALGAPGAAHAAAPIWRLEQPPPPAGAPFKVALGTPGDLKFWSASRGLLAVEGNALIPRGLFAWNGESWRQLAVVCGGSGDTTRIAWAGPAEFWVISAPSRPQVGDGIALCHFKDGQVAASYGTLPSAADPYRVMDAATCSGPDDCWFGGPASTDPAGARTGAFRLHWDGTALTTSYGPQGRGISDLQAFGGTVTESVLAGPAPEVRAPAQNRVPEPEPRLLHRLTAGRNAFEADPWTPAAVAGVPAEGTELLALDADGQRLWAVGGGAASGPDAPADTGVVDRPPVVATRTAGQPFREVALQAPDGSFGAGDRLVDVAAVPGTETAWTAVQPFAERRSVNAKARVALVDAATGSAQLQRLPLSGAGRGSAARIACPAAGQCWLATYAGWLFHYSDGTALPVDADPAFAALITFRPNESAAQFVPDTPPVDDSLLLAPPPVELPAAATAAPTKTKRLKALITGLRRPQVHGTTLILRFRIRRRARISLVAERRSATVARTPLKLYRPGRVTLRLKLDRRRWPTRLRFVVKEPGQPSESGGSDQQTVTTGGSDPTTTTTTTTTTTDAGGGSSGGATISARRGAR